MQLERDEYKIQDDGIWISKKALEECKKHYRKVADKFKPKPKKQRKISKRKQKKKWIISKKNRARR